MSLFLRQAQAFAFNAVLEAFRNKIFYITLFVAALAMGAASLFGALSLHQEERLFHDLVFALSIFFLVALAIYQSTGTIHREISTSTIIAVLAKPVSRTAFLAGKYVANVFVLLIASILLFGLKIAAARLLGFDFSPQELAIYSAGFLQITIIIALAFFFSSFAGPFFSALCTFLLFIAGNLTPQMEEAAKKFHGDGNPVAYLLDLARHILPDFEKLNLSYELTYGLPIPTSYMIHALLYALSTVLLLMIFTTTLFARRDFS